ncbi:acyl-CoA dehydrogenase family protein [Hyphobacterium sp. HN65]|uniref:Acyl-CoA dehydrogenase family protein n=1 Tax=Hyphobacterium lacteum TaxID=3116575 RepID=A0ABU7LP27_9PROT|nr:acyl-CoA dehydrogenase family protein [Hyphobacterium sp. HN65]MEE2525663.1 acyl-CoA dehydrogenase family protein [Hyphobacterium sp. HN65]
MADTSFLEWPFFEDSHRELAAAARAWCAGEIGETGFAEHADVDADCRAMARKMGETGWLKNCVPAAYGGANETLDVRSLCIMRETLGYHSGLADFVFAMQGLGSGTLSLFGSDQQKAEWLPKVAAGEALAAFALTEPQAGSDVASLAMKAERDGGDYVLNGEKTYISNGGIAGFYTVFARTGEAGARGISAFLVPADTPGLSVAERIEVIAPHPLARLKFENCRIPASALIGEENAGFKYAMGTLDVFRSTVAAAALGFARRAMDEARARAKSRQLFGDTLADLPVVQSQLAEMAIDIDASALLIYRGAWMKDSGVARISREAAMSKFYATETAQQTIDKAVQIFGGLGVTKGSVPEALYRDIRALRIYEGASEVQKLIIARQLLSEGS